VRARGGRVACPPCVVSSEENDGEVLPARWTVILGIRPSVS
jgi:hypothetical protein